MRRVQTKLSQTLRLGLLLMLVVPLASTLVSKAQSDTDYPVVDMALSPDGALLAATGRRYETQSGEERFPIDIIDALTGQLVTSLDSEFPILSVSWSADSTQIVTSDSWGPVVIWTVADGSAIGLTGGGAIQVNQVQWSPVSDEIAFPVGIAIDLASANGIEHGLVDREIEGRVWLFDWSPDGNRIASVGGGYLRIWDTVERPVNGNLLNRFEVDPIVALDWHPDGDRIAIGNGEGLIRILDPETGQDLSVFSVGMTIDYVIVWSPTGDQIAVGMESHEIGIWDVSTGDLLKTLSIETYISALAWSPDGTRLYHNGGPEGVYVNGVPLSSGDIPPLFAPPTAAAGPDQTLTDDEGVWWASWHPSGELLAVSYRNDNTLHLLDATTLQVTQTLTITNPQMASAVSALWGLRWSPDGNKIALGASLFQGGEFTQLVDVNTGQALWTVNPEAIGWDTVSVMDWSSDGTELFVYLREGRGLVAKHQVQIWEALTMEPRLTIRLSDDPGAIAWSPDGSRIVTSVDNTPVVWDAETGAQLFTQVGHADFVAGAQWSPDGSRIATGGENVRIWDALTGLELLSVGTYMCCGHEINWSPDGTRIAIQVESDGWIWDTATNQLSNQFTSYQFLLWRPAGDRLVTLDHHNQLLLVDSSGTYIPVSPAAGPDQALTGSDSVPLDG